MNADHDIQSDTTTAREDAQAMVEFALVLPVLCLILFAIIQFGLAFWHYQMLSAATSEGARRGAISRTYTDRTSRVVTSVKENSPQLDSSKLSVTVTSTWAAGSTIKVTSTYPQKIEVMGLTLFDQNLTATRTMRVEQ